MTYDVQIRHSRPVSSGDGYEHYLECLRMEETSEEDVFKHIRQTCNDHIACIDAWHHQGISPYSVDTGESAFFTEATRPMRSISLDEARAG